VSEFHRLILEGSRNDFLARFVEALAPFQRIHQTEYLDPKEAHVILEEHAAINAALRARDGARAQLLMVEHYDRGRAYWREVDLAEGRTRAGSAATIVPAARVSRPVP
jgi:DNA-binding GntR family transcriptional regulator